jgi:hypothetical protein
MVKLYINAFLCIALITGDIDWSTCDSQAFTLGFLFCSGRGISQRQLRLQDIFCSAALNFKRWQKN